MDIPYFENNPLFFDRLLDPLGLERISLPDSIPIINRFDPIEHARGFSKTLQSTARAEVGRREILPPPSAIPKLVELLPKSETSDFTDLFPKKLLAKETEEFLRKKFKKCPACGRWGSLGSFCLNPKCGKVLR